MCVYLTRGWLLLNSAQDFKIHLRRFVKPQPVRTGNIVKASSLSFSWSVKSGFLCIFNWARLKQRRGFTVCHRGPHYSHINHVTGWKEQLKRVYSYEFQWAWKGWRQRNWEGKWVGKSLDLWKQVISRRIQLAFEQFDGKNSGGGPVSILYASQSEEWEATKALAVIKAQY